MGYRKPSCFITSLTGGVESSFRIQPNSSSSDFHCAMPSSLDRTDLIYQETSLTPGSVCPPALKFPGEPTGIFLPTQGLRPRPSSPRQGYQAPPPCPAGYSAAHVR